MELSVHIGLCMGSPWLMFIEYGIASFVAVFYL